MNNSKGYVLKFLYYLIERNFFSVAVQMIKIESLAEFNAFGGNKKSIELLIEVSELSFYDFFFRNNLEES